MRPVRVVGGLCATALVLQTWGCGVPEMSQPIDRGTAPAVDVPERLIPAQPKGPDDGGLASAQDLIQRYFQAAAWGNSEGGNRPDAVDEAERRVRAFLTEESATTWSAGNRELNLVRATLGDPRTGPDGTVSIEATIEPVGVLDSVGSVRAPATATVTRYTFSVVPTEGGRHKRLVGAPTGLFLDVNYLTDWYDVRTIYFWAAGSTAVLVPDRRYMPKVVNLDKQPNEVWRWLTKGPSDLIAPAVATLPDTVKLKGNVVTEHNDDGTVLVIDLNSEAAGQQLQPVVNQFRWSMGPNGLPVELRIEGVRKEVEGQSDQYLRFNPAVWPEGQMEPEKLFIVGGRIQPAKTTAGPPFQILAGEENQDVITAALARQSTQQRLAFVRDDGDGRQRLWLGQLVGQSTARAPTYLRTDIVGTSLSRPVWLTGDIPRVLLSVDGKLVCVTADGQRSSVVSEPGVPTTVTAIAAAPDGRRLAIVGGGEAGIVPLRVDGDTLSLRGFFPLVTGLAEDKVIGWSRQDTVLVGGTGAEGSPLVEVSVDGTWREPTERSGLDGLVVTSLVVYPDDPSQNGERVLAMFEAGQRAYNVFGQQVEQLLVDSGQQASPSGEAESPDGADPEAVPRAPLFYESI